MTFQIDLSQVIDMKEGTFWILINILLAIAPVDFLLFLVIQLNLKSRFPNSYFVGVAISFSMVLLLVLGNAVFMSFIEILLRCSFAMRHLAKILATHFWRKTVIKHTGKEIMQFTRHSLLSL
jgi:hypothetical protein